MIDAEAFRAALSQWPTGVGVVTTVAGDGWHGMTASSVCSVSLDPPLVLVCLAEQIYTHRLVAESGVFAISFLAKDQTRIGEIFAGRVAGDRFAGRTWEPRQTGAPVLADAVGWLDCRVVHAYPGGDHTIFVGAVQAAGTPRRTAPLLFHSRAWGQLADPLPAEMTVADTGLAAVLQRRLQPNGTAPARVTRHDAHRLLAALRSAGVRTRLDIESLALSGIPPAVTDGNWSVVLHDPAQVARLAGARDGVVEVHAAAERPDLVTREIVNESRRRGLATVARISDAFAPARTSAVLDAVERLAGLGCTEIALDEGSAPASPLHVRNLLQEAVARARPTPLRLRLHEAYGLGLVNALTALKSGVHRFDVTLGGIDGGLCAEDLLFLATQLAITSPVDRAGLVSAATELERLWGAVLPGRTYRVAAGPALITADDEKGTP
ncbi:flavin reductase [Actinomadura barringtoniae]|uniref:Flavin reductase n=1 Tax=Actinomadura barringtoniae TaxID=1427535 RepID=A0A939T649_9ACTN|nr:flavin reductase [Actinomadura barringtoniae]MBO2447862.1 flavin reductase [Actinomadura barringtoniae]